MLARIDMAKYIIVWSGGVEYQEKLGKALIYSKKVEAKCGL
jgi:hypothetical protein